MTRLPILITLVIAACCAALPASAKTVRIDETHPAAPDTKLDIELVAGSVTIRGWDRPEIQITGHYDDEYSELRLDSSERETSIEIEPTEHGSRRSGGDTLLEIQLPAGAEIEFESVSAGVDIDGVHGVTSVESVSGDVSLSGDTLELEVSTVSGDLVAKARELRGAELDSVSGDLELHGRLDSDGRFSFETVSGDIRLHLSADTSADIDVEAFSGTIENQLGPPAEKSSKWLPSTSLRFALGGGDARVSAETISGDIRILPE